MINPVEVVIQAVKAAAPLYADGNVATKHHFVAAGSAEPELWPVDGVGCVIGLDGGTAELYLPVHDIRLAVRCYGTSQENSLVLLLDFMSLARTLNRIPVVVSAGTGLLYFLLPASGPSLLYDTDLAKDFGLQFYHAQVHEQGVE